MTKLLSIQAKADAPVACDMSAAPDSLAERLAEYRRLFEHALVGRESTPTATTFRLSARPGVAEWVRDLATREAGCCGFLSYEIEEVGDEIVWTISGGPGSSDVAALDDLLDATAAFPAGSEEIAALLRERGLRVIGVRD